VEVCVEIRLFYQSSSMAGSPLGACESVEGFSATTTAEDQRLLPLGELQRRAAELDRSRPVVCVCRSGKRSAQAVEKLVALGFDEVHQLDGGLMAWEQAGPDSCSCPR